MVSTLLTQDEYGYFSSSQLKNWAGPSHWLSAMPKTLRKQDEKTSKKAPKEKLSIDFSRTFDTTRAFACGRASTVLASQVGNKLTDAFSLPEDLHYKSSDLTKLFCKPKVKVCPGRITHKTRRAIISYLNKRKFSPIFQSQYFFSK